VTTEPDIHEDPVAAFLSLWERVKETVPAGFDPAAAALATATVDGRPSVRTVLLRGVTARGFQFFTNYGSRKARELDANPRASLCFHWHWLDEQVRVEGTTERTTAEESDAYFATRPRGSQLGAWASRQSEPLASRAALEARYHDLERQYDGGIVPRPAFWGGYTLVPVRIEFWRAGEFRLHHRVAYTRADDRWTAERLYP
jgi:pyridoxamine 5'-phosphate oxidase